MRKKEDFLKRRIPVICDCEKHKAKEKIRAKFGVNTCDAYSFYYKMGLILSNGLFQYLSDAKERIVRNDWDKIEKCAQSIQDFAEASHWDLLSEKIEVRNAFLDKERNFREAMFWLSENWHSLWW